MARRLGLSNCGVTILPTRCKVIDSKQWKSRMARGRIFTIGHGGRSQEAVFEKLSREKVSYVVDVRSVPYSRFQPDFSRDQLEASLRQNNMNYVFMGDLLGGRPKDESCYTDGKVDYTKTRTKEFFIRGISRLRKAYDQGFSVCLLCSEGHPSDCHRSKLVGAALFDDGIDVTHILPDGVTRTQDEVIDQLTDRQPGLFGEHFVSRKSYR